MKRYFWKALVVCAILIIPAKILLGRKKPVEGEDPFADNGRSPGNNTVPSANEKLRGRISEALKTVEGRVKLAQALKDFPEET